MHRIGSGCLYSKLEWYKSSVYNGPIEQSDRLILNSEDDLTEWYERTVENFVKNGQ